MTCTFFLQHKPEYPPESADSRQLIWLTRTWLTVDPPSHVSSSSLSPSLSLLSSPFSVFSPSPLSPQSQGCAHRLDTTNRDAARAQRSLKMAPPRVLWIYPSLSLHSSSPLLLLLLLFHTLSQCGAVRNYPENEGGCCGSLSGPSVESDAAWLCCAQSRAEQSSAGGAAAPSPGQPRLWMMYKEKPREEGGQK